jgi:integrin alpha FG-GAP repeat containing protein 1
MIRLILEFTLSQFAHFALQMPTTMFGLGRSPKFVDNITVGLAPVTGQEQDGHTKVFVQTIPNSAVVISPKSLTKPLQWRAFIFVTPSSAMLEVAAMIRQTLSG